MAAVSRAYLAVLRALAHPPYDREAIEVNLLDRLQNGISGLDGLTTWTAAPADNLRRALPLLAELMYLHGEQENSNFHMGQMINSQGPHLDVFGVERNVIRRDGENDDDYLFRLANSGLTQNIGTLTAIESQIFDFNSEIVDAQAVIRSNRQDMDVYVLKASHALISASDKTALLAHLNERRRKIAGVDIFAPDPTLTAFTIDVTVRHPESFSANTAAADARDGIYAWLEENQRLGEPVYRSAIIAAAFVAGVADVTVTAPAADLAATDGTAYTCGANTTEVAVTTVAI